MRQGSRVCKISHEKRYMELMRRNEMQQGITFHPKMISNYAVTTGSRSIITTKIASIFQPVFII